MINITNDRQEMTHVLMMEDSNSRQTFVLQDANYSIGRDARNSIRIESKQVSRFHATLLKRNDVRKNTFSYWILDGDLQGNRSRNGVFINEIQCLVQELRHEDVIHLGPEVRIQYYIISSLDSLVLPSSSKTTHRQKTFEEKNQTMERDDKSTIILSISQKSEALMQEQNLEKLASFPELSPNPIIEIDWSGAITYLNPAASSKFPEITKTPDHPLLLGLIKNIKQENKDNKLFVREVKLNHQIFEQYIHYLSDQQLIRTYVFDFTKRKQLEAQLKESELRYKTVINQTKEAIFMADSFQHKILEANNAFSDLLGYSLDEIYSLNLTDIFALQPVDLQKEINNYLTMESNLTKTFNFYHKDKSLVSLECDINLLNYGDQQILCFSLRQDNLSFSGDYLEKGVFDLSTGLPNRRFFLEQLNTAIANNKRQEGILALILIEIEELKDFKITINSQLESSLLEDCSERLKDCIRAGDTLAKWDNNQFIVLLPSVKREKNLGKISTRILDSFAHPFVKEKRKILVKTNMAIGIYEKKVDSAEQLINNTKKALNQSKKKANSNFQFYNQKVQENIEKLTNLEKSLITALEKQEFFLHYQPQINLKNKEITAVEAFVRWQHPDSDYLLPSQFLELAEDTGLIIPIGKWILEEVCQKIQLWQENYSHSFVISLNISLQEFQHPNFVELIKNILQKTNLNPEFLELEITEKTLATDLDLSTQILKELNQIGVNICLDDFGRGTSGINYLKDFKFNTLKIDQSLIKNVVQDNQEIPIISALINLGDSFGIRVVAEGVETKEQLELLTSLGCEEFQGHLFSVPLKEEEIINFVSYPVFNF